MNISSSRSGISRFRLRAGLVVPAAMALTLLTACSSTTSGQGSAASKVSPTSASAPAVAAAPSTAAAPASPAPASSPASASAESSAPVSAAPVSSAPIPSAPAPASPTSQDSSTSTPTTPDAPAPSAPSAKNVLGPDGYLGVKLGESQPTAKLDAIFTSTPAATNSCQDWDTVAAAPIGPVLINAKLGIAGISPRDPSKMRTPEGMTAGWTAKQVHATYPSFNLSDTHEEDGGPEIAVPQDADAVYKVRFDSSDEVVGFSLLLRNHGCFD